VCQEQKRYVFAFVQRQVYHAEVERNTVRAEIWLVLDDGAEVHLEPSDCVAQNDTHHAWHTGDILIITIVALSEGTNVANRLDGKVAIVTGGSSGIGEATAHLFVQEGAKVAIMARREKEGMAVQNAIRAEGGDALFIQCDVADRRAVDTAVTKTIDTYGRLNILFNNAGSGIRENFPEETDEGWDQVIQVNLTGTFYMCRAAWNHLIAAGGGAIINMSSTAAVGGFSPTLADMAKAVPSASYYASKAGVDAFTRYIAGMGARHNIRVNCVRPGQILTPLVNVDGEHRYKPLFDIVQMLEGTGYPIDVANAVLFLASEESRFITGEFIHIDGGMPIKL
jgi:NAD(P)-dependent dehydrogenase (short-subunit alcohol dehydrogenase family)